LKVSSQEFAAGKYLCDLLSIIRAKACNILKTLAVEKEAGARLRRELSRTAERGIAPERTRQYVRMRDRSDNAATVPSAELRSMPYRRIRVL